MKFKRILGVMVIAAIGGCAGTGSGSGSGFSLDEAQRTVREMANDATITASVNAALLKDEDLSVLTINVDTNHGIVTLHGSVDSKKARKKAVALTQSVKGVRRVVSRLKVIDD